MQRKVYHYRNTADHRLALDLCWLSKMPPNPANGKASEGSSRPQAPRSNPSTLQPGAASSSQDNGGGAGGDETKKKRRRGGRRHNRNRRESFAPPSETDSVQGTLAERPNLETVTEGQQQSSSFYKLGNRADSNSSLESEALLDHRYLHIPRVYVIAHLLTPSQRAESQPTSSSPKHSCFRSSQ